MTEENKYRALFEDFLLHQHEVNPPVRSIDAVKPAITFQQIIKDITTARTPVAKRCNCCNDWFVPGVGVWAEKGYYVPIGEMCAWCLEIRNHALELGLVSSRE